jgi:hypothetical protein
MSQYGFELVVSGNIKQLQAYSGIDLQPDRAALEDMAEATRVALLPVPRMLLLNAGQNPYPPGGTFLYDGELPRYESENDIVVRLLKRNQLNEPTLTASIARALIDRRQAEVNQKGGTFGRASIIGGVVLSFISEIALHSPSLPMIGIIIAGTGLASVAYFSNRSEAPLPATNLFQPPIRVVDRDVDKVT